MNNLLKIYINSQGNAEVTLANIANVILAYDLSEKSAEQLNASYSYIYKIFERLGLFAIKKNITGNIKIPLYFLEKLLTELQEDPDKFNEKYVKVKQQSDKKPNYYSANYCYKLLKEIQIYKQQQYKEKNIDEVSIKKFIENPSKATFPKNIQNPEKIVEVIKNLSSKYHINFKWICPYSANIFRSDLSNIFYRNSDNKIVLVFDKLYYHFASKTDVDVQELQITKITKFANNKLKDYGWNNAEICFVSQENLKQIKILFTNQQQLSKLNFGDLILLNFQHKIANSFTKNDKQKICFFHKYVSDVSTQQFLDDFNEIVLNNIFSQIDFNSKVIEFLKEQKLSKTFFNSTEIKELYKEVIANLYNLQTMYNHCKGIKITDEIPNFLVDKIL